MANRDAKLIERTLKDFSLGAMSGGGAGLTPVSALPEKGNVGALYKLPNGEIWSWYHEERQEEIEVPDIKAGDTLVLLNTIDTNAFCDGMDKLLNVKDSKRLDTKLVSFELENSVGDEGIVLKEVCIECGYAAEAEDPCNYRKFRFGNFASGNNVAMYGWDDVRPIIEVELDRNFKDVPLIHITQELIDKLAANDISIEDIAFVFSDVPTKTETITVVEEGYTKVNGAIVLDIDNIQDSTIYNDTYYNASLIIDNVKRGVPVTLKDGGSFNTLASATFEEGSSFISFSNGTNITLIPENVFGPATITGAELKEQMRMRIIKGELGLNFRGDNLMNFIRDSGQVSGEEAQKLMAPGTIISLFDGLITLDYILSTAEEGDHIDYELYLASPTQPMSEQFGRFRRDHPRLADIYCNQSSTVVRSDWSNIEDSKEYSTDIIIKFADSTTKAIKTTKDYISTIFVQDIPN